MNKLNQAGASHILILVAVVGFLFFLLISNAFDFKDKLFSNLFPKPPSHAVSPYKIGAYYFGMWSSTDTVPDHLDNVERVYGRRDLWGGVKDFYGLEPGIPKDTRGWTGDFSHLKPEIGYYDYSISGPTILEQQIIQAKQNGLSFFNFYWYWDSTYKKEFLSSGINSFLQATNKNQLQFMISIAAHPWCNGPTCLSIPLQDGVQTTQIIVDKYFSQPNYLKTQNGRPIIFILDSRGMYGGTIQDTQDYISLLKLTSQNRLGVEPIVLISVENPDARSITNTDGYSCVATYIQPSGAQSYQYYLDNFTNHFATFTDKPLMPCFVSNFDERPRQDISITDRNQIRYFSDFSETLFRDGVTRVKQYMDSQTNELSKILTIYAWNEWHEGGIIEPNVRDKNKRLSIIAETFSLTTNPIGTFDLANCSLIEGWTCDADDYNATLNVHLYKDGPYGSGIFIASTSANITREPAVGSSCGGNPNHGFSYVTPPSLMDSQPHTIYAYGIDIPSGTNSILNGNPKTIQCNPTPSPTPTPSPSPSPTPTPTPPPKTGDINGDGSVNVVDFSILLSKWNTSDSASDLNGDGIVNVVDFSILLSNWGT